MTEHPPAGPRAEPRPLVPPPVLVALAVAQAVVPVLPRVLHYAPTEEEQSRATSGPLTPVPAAFAVWGPLFATSIAYPLVARRGDDRAGDPAGDPLVAAAFALDVLWSLNTQFRRLDGVSVALIAAAGAAAGTAVERAERRRPAGAPDRARAALVGPLAGWLAVATAANLETTLNLRRGRPRRGPETRRAVGLLAGATAVIGSAALRNRGNPGYAAAAGWGLGGILVRAVREGRREVAGAAALSLLGVGAAALAGRRGR
jgi:TspO/MBR family protein